MPAKDPAVRRSIATEAALLRWANEDPTANAVRGQAGLKRKFFDATDPTLPEPERQRRADCAYRAHMVRIRRQRSKRTGRTPDGEAA
jgi:hypothetical protein